MNTLCLKILDNKKLRNPIRQVDQQKQTGRKPDCFLYVTHSQKYDRIRSLAVKKSLVPLFESPDPIL